MISNCLIHSFIKSEFTIGKNGSLNIQNEGISSYISGTSSPMRFTQISSKINKRSKDNNNHYEL